MLNRDGINYGDRSVVAEDRVILADPRRLLRLRSLENALLKNGLDPATDGNRGSIHASWNGFFEDNFIARKLL